MKILYSCNKDGGAKLRPKTGRVLPQSAIKVAALCTLSCYSEVYLGVSVNLPGDI